MATLRSTRRSLRSGQLVLVGDGSVSAKTEFQKGRLVEAVSAAKVYLGGDMKAGEMAKSLGVTEERAAQMIRLGISYMEEVGWLKPADSAGAPSVSGLGRG